MPYINPTTPNLTDFATFVYDVMQISTTNLPTNSPYITYAFYRAQNLVVSVPGVSGYDYTNAVYNCAGHCLIVSAQDQTGLTFFSTLRTDYSIGQMAAGVVSSTSDASTAVTLAVPDGLAQLTISDLGFFKTPWGREYLAYNQDFGSLFGLS